MIECKKVTLCYDRRVVVKDLSFSVNKGDYLCIVGENGSGKSTLIKSLLGLKKPADGKIQLMNGFTRRHMGYLPQQTPVQQDFPATVEEIVRSGLLGRSKGIFYSKAGLRKAEQMMAALELLPLKKACFRNLSGGQQQRVLLARSLTAAEQMLVLDEPATGLDSTVTEELYNYIHKEHQTGMTVVMVSHDIDRAMRTADRILHLAGDGTFFGTPAEYARSPYYGRLHKGVRSCG